MRDKLTILVVTLSVGLIFSGLSLFAMLAFARATNLAVVTGDVGFGPTLFRPTILGVPVNVRLLPLSSSIQVYPMPSVPKADPRYEAVATSVAAGERRAWGELGFGGRLGFILLAFLVAAAMAVVALGPLKGAECTMRDLVSVVRGALAPLTTARHKLDGVLNLLRERGAFALAQRYTALLCAAQFASVTINLPLLPRDRSRRRIALESAGVALLLVLLLVVWGAWLVAFLTWLFHDPR